MTYNDFKKETEEILKDEKDGAVILSPDFAQKIINFVEAVENLETLHSCHDGNVDCHGCESQEKLDKAYTELKYGCPSPIR